MAVENKKAIRVYIPNDIAFSILSKLPLKSIKRFTSASKSWSLLFENPHFMKEFRNNFISKLHSIDDEDTCLLLHQSAKSYPFHMTLYMVFQERFEFEERVKIDWPPPLLGCRDPIVQILGSSSVNGILCVFYESIIVLWNPANGEFKVIPHSRQPCDNIEIYSRPQGFGYDHIRDDYKVIRSARYPKGFEGNNRYDDFWEVYSLNSNSWRRLDGDDMPFPWPRNSQVNLNEVCHWFGIGRDIVSFDFTNEIFFTTTLPTDTLIEKTQPSNMEYTLLHGNLAVLNESVAYIGNLDLTAYFNIWILGELGVKESWTKLFVIGPFIGVQFPIGAWFPMRVGNKGNVFFKKEDVELAWLDLSTQRIEEIDDGKGMYGSTMIVNYKKNLRSIRGMNM